MFGEPVMVITAMGSFVAKGFVTAVYQTGGVQVREFETKSSYGDRIYDSSLYSFVPVAPPAGDESEGDEGEVLDEEPEEQAPSKAQAVDAKADEKAASMPAPPQSAPKPASKSPVVSSHQLDEEQLNRVISEISDAALRVLKAVGVKDIDVYTKVAEIQKVVNTVLKGE
tara:strand:- start:1806 stop:2312 length:507 start_codon:yes stop_codon:yes gene_type:complete